MFTQSEEDYVPGGYICVLLIEKVSDYNLEGFGELSIEKRNQIRIAFAKAIRWVSPALNTYPYL